MEMLKSNGIANKENLIPIQNAKNKSNEIVYVNWDTLDCFIFYYPVEPQSRSDNVLFIGTAYKIICNELTSIETSHKRKINSKYFIPSRETIVWQ